MKYNPLNKAVRATTKYTLSSLVSAIEFEIRKVITIIRVTIISDTKFGRNGSASLVILFRRITYPKNKGIANRLMTMVQIVSIQGFILFGVAFIELNEMNPINLAFILLETILVKALAIPLFLLYSHLRFKTKYSVLA